MALGDRETGEEIINPYITLYSPENALVVLNTGTFGKAQTEIIYLDDRKTYIKYACNEKRRLYMVVSTTEKQDYHVDGKGWGKRIMSEGVSDARALIPLGYILEQIVKELFPKSFTHFEIVRKEHENR